MPKNRNKGKQKLSHLESMIGGAYPGWSPQMITSGIRSNDELSDAHNRVCSCELRAIDVQFSIYIKNVLRARIIQPPSLPRQVSLSTLE
jgi:hypothetical protein